MSSATPGAIAETTQRARADGEPPAHAKALPRSLHRSPADARWIGRRARLLAVLALFGCAGLFLLARALALSSQLDADWRAIARDRIELSRSEDTRLAPSKGRVLDTIGGRGATVAAIDVLALRGSARWIVSDAERARHRALHEQLAAAFTENRVTLSFTDGTQLELSLSARGYAGLGASFWMLGLLALGLWLVSMTVLLAKPSLRNLLYVVMSIGQAGNLLLMAASRTAETALPAGLVGLMGFMQWDLHARTAFDLISAGAIVHAAALHPRRLPRATPIAAAGWSIALALLALSLAQPPGAWWWTQAGLLGLGLAAIWLYGWSHRLQPHPVALLSRRFGIVAAAAYASLSAGIAALPPELATDVATVGPLLWTVAFAWLLLLVPFLSRSQQVLREFALLAAVAALASALDRLFVEMFLFGELTSLALTLFLALGTYTAARRWIAARIRRNNLPTNERMFEQLYRIAREVEARPADTARQLSQLLRELFAPLEVALISKATPRARVVADGSTLLVPVPAPAGASAPLAQSIVVRFARQGQRLFTQQDAQLAERVVEQLQRAIAFDRAVELGRSEERQRLAQDLHDDIGARLLTLMYKAESPEVEDYVRHTLQDLKTLTRGLAAPHHPLSYAAAEWKSDLTQRLALAQCELRWSASFDEDLTLSVVQWSALTRVLRELASNVIAHAKATELRVSLQLRHDRLELTAADDGCGEDPQTWSHGLGLGGVRKRVKQLGGAVQWSQVVPRGIACSVVVEEFSRRR